MDFSISTQLVLVIMNNKFETLAIFIYNIITVQQIIMLQRIFASDIKFV